MELNPKDFNFGEIWQGTPAKREFTVKNVGAAPLTLNATTSCGCTVASKPTSPLPPGETTTFSITYNTGQPGHAGKVATLTTNDPNQATVTIKVEGDVKPLFAATPADRITFQAMELESRESQTIKLENKYTGPLHLKLKADQDLGRFEAELKEVREGQEYELTVTTKPPLTTGTNAGAAILETGLEAVPTVTIQLLALVQPRVSVIPAQLFVTQATTQPLEQMVRVQYRADKPLKIVAVNPSLDTIQCEVKEDAPIAPDAKTAFHQIRVTLPPYDKLPAEGAKIEIVTDDPAPEFQKLTLQVVKRAPPPPKPPTVRPGPQ
jgi:hypothetical protein